MVIWDRLLNLHNFLGNSMKRKEYFEKLIEIIEELKEESKKGTPLLVEGKNDILSLKNLGIDGYFIKVSNTPFFEIADELVKHNIKEVILLTDFDKAGRDYAKEIIKEFQSRGIKVNNEIRKNILRYSHGDLKDIEGLYTYLKNKVIMVDIE